MTTPEIPSWPAPTSDELAALDELGSGGIWRIDGREVRLTNLDKVLFPGRDEEPPITKRELIRHHACSAPVMLPYLFDRAVNLHRYPDGVEHGGFWNKERPANAPDWVTPWRYPDAGPDDTKVYTVPDHPATLVWLANLGAIELHPWTSPTRAWTSPSWALFDLDPGTKSTFEDVLVLARLHRTALEHLGVRAGPKVTGRGGIQIWVPVAPGHDFEQTRTWVETVSRSIGAVVPELVSWAWNRAERRGLARLDYTQNAVNKTLVAPFSTRPSPGAPVSVPITWDELDDPDLAPDRWTIRTLGRRLEAVGDPLRPLIGLAQELPEL